MSTKPIEFSRIFLIFLVLFIGVAALYYFFVYKENGSASSGVNSFDECAEAGYPILETYPLQCKTSKGETFVQEVREPIISESWETYFGTTFSFQYPVSWNPQPTELTPGSITETVDLGIPGVEVDKTMGYSALTELEKPDDVAEESTIELDNTSAVKWIRKGTGYVSYDYYITKENIFNIHVTVPEENTDLEDKLDYIISSLIFYEQQPAVLDSSDTETQETTEPEL
ncbi:MAG: hypothetical protein UU80_C0006G0013 [candidate division WWE3 bacterium GW2011_GWA1_41_8]|uniref:Uncharacterized protein n=3 Tax=Katanobacteria TaxID=422282 RepID=A0A0G0XDL9_UNCKA|nr:MAG: hypothetical protein UU72_C0009G0002 [candidate division WWE3 bacterium GW2011_GWB1_41_6]KKS22487.1 MAG: hypothetical protein UU80_C0006G0013 [candidate division WWE3 bacterium GW2011_GWA1_41_8]